jgi:uncharacterized membrane protein YhfC
MGGDCAAHRDGCQSAARKENGSEANMNILYVTYSLNIFLLFAIPIALGIYLTRKFKLDRRLWWIGAAVYVLSQVVHIPFNAYVVNPLLDNLSNSAALPSIAMLIAGALLLGLSAGLWEELFRYAMFRWWAKDARSWGSGLLVGTGHGGAEAILLGLLVLYNFSNMIAVRNMDISTLVPADQLVTVQAQINAFWSAPWYYTIREAVDQFFTIPIQICFAILILQTFIRKQWYWVLLAIGFHTLVEATKVVAQNLLNVYLTELIIGVFAILSVVIVFALRRPEPPADLTPAASVGASSTR